MFTEQEIQANRKRWADALRSGKYDQVNGVLRSSFGYCCLGVACDVSDVGCWVGYNYDIDDEASLETSIEGSLIRDELGLTDEQVSDFITLNDDFHLEFDLIAKAAEDPSQLRVLIESRA